MDIEQNNEIVMVTIMLDRVTQFVYMWGGVSIHFISPGQSVLVEYCDHFRWGIHNLYTCGDGLVYCKVQEHERLYNITLRHE